MYRYIPNQMYIEQKQETVPISREGNSDLILNMSIDILKLSNRSSNVLHKYNINTIGQLMNYSDEQLFRLRNMGQTSLSEIKGKLSQLLSAGREGYEQTTYTSSLEKLQSILSVRSYNALKNYGIKTVGDLLNLSSAEIYSIPNVGKLSAEEIQQTVVKLRSSMIHDTDYNESEKTDNTIYKTSKDENTFQNKIHLDDLCLSVRTHNALSKAGIKTLDQLLELSPEKLLSIRGLGKKCFEELDEVVNGFASKGLQTNCDVISPKQNELDACFIKYSIQPFQEANYNQLLAIYIEDRYAITHILELINQAGYSSSQSSFTRSLESILLIEEVQTIDEILELMFSTLTSREKEIILYRNGIIGGQKTTLEDLAKPYGVTRERVRQLERKAERKNNHPKARDRMLGVAVKLYKLIMDQGGIIHINRLANLIDQEYLNVKYDGKKLAVYIMKRWEWFNHLNEDIWFINNLKYDPNEIGNSVYEILNCSQNPTSLIDLVNAIPVLNNGNLQTDVLSTILAGDGRFTEKDGVIGLSNWSHFNPRTRKDMIICAMRDLGTPAHYSLITQKINQIFGTNFSENHIHSALGLYPQEIAWIGQKGIYGLVEMGAERVASYIDAVKDILHEANNPMYLDDIVNKVSLLRQCKKSSVLLTLTYNDKLFASFGKDLYGLAEWKNQPYINVNPPNINVILDEEHIDDIIRLLFVG